jgi:hypothetical protein
LCEGIEDFLGVKIFYKSKICKNFEVGQKGIEAPSEGIKDFFGL